MTILLLSWANFGTADIRDAFEELGHRVILLSTTQNELLGDDEATPTPEMEKTIHSIILQNVDQSKPDIIFGFNYFPEVAKSCKELDIPYYSWVYDNPCIQLFSYTVLFPTNHIFVFDSDTYYRFANQGIKTISFLPMAANPKRLSKLWNAGSGKMEFYPKNYQADISFVGSLYTEEHQFYQRMMQKGISPYAEGYLRGLMESQKNLYGCNIIESALTDAILQEMHRALPLEPEVDSAATMQYLFSEFVINRQITAEERTDLLTSIAGATGENNLRRNLYTRDRQSKIAGWNNCGPIDFYEAAPRVFHNSKINLNISLRSIVNGIPLRCFEIMASGGFLLTNYQGDFDLFFENGRDYVAFESEEDLMDKVAYYLGYDKEREEIARNGYRRICEAHTYRHRAEEMLRMMPTEG